MCEAGVCLEDFAFDQGIKAWDYMPSHNRDKTDSKFRGIAFVICQANSKRLLLFAMPSYFRPACQLPSLTLDVALWWEGQDVGE